MNTSPQHTSPSAPVPRLLLHALRTFAQTTHTRNHLITLSRSSQNYCSTCTPFPTSFPCTATCPLLSPYTYGPREICPIWLSRVVKDLKLYHDLVADIKDGRRNVSEERVQAWMGAAEMLRYSGMSDLEKRFEKGWMVVDMRGAVGMNLDWSFDGKWRDIVEEEMVGPDEGVIGKRAKRGRGEEDEGGERRRKRVKVKEMRRGAVGRSKRIARVRRA